MLDKINLTLAPKTLYTKTSKTETGNFGSKSLGYEPQLSSTQLYTYELRNSLVSF